MGVGVVVGGGGEVGLSSAFLDLQGSLLPFSDWYKHAQSNYVSSGQDNLPFKDEKVH